MDNLPWISNFSGEKANRSDLVKLHHSNAGQIFGQNCSSGDRQFFTMRGDQCGIKISAKFLLF